MFTKGTNCMRKYSDFLTFGLQINDRVQSLVVQFISWRQPAPSGQWVTERTPSSDIIRCGFTPVPLLAPLIHRGSSSLTRLNLSRLDTDFKQQSQCYFPSEPSFPNLKEPLRSLCSAANKFSILVLSPIFFLTSKIKFRSRVH